VTGRVVKQVAKLGQKIVNNVDGQNWDFYIKLFIIMYMYWESLESVLCVLSLQCAQTSKFRQIWSNCVAKIIEYITVNP
jgi:hypothetical protein